MPIIQFKGKTAVESYHRVVPHHTLEIDSAHSPANKPGLDGNLIIEGDNLIALKSLLPTHAGRIKCVYIDPPYNTGNEGWVYNANLTQPQFKEWIGKTVTVCDESLQEACEAPLAIARVPKAESPSTRRPSTLYRFGGHEAG